jgi:hypothetical protein
VARFAVHVFAAINITLSQVGAIQEVTMFAFLTLLAGAVFRWLITLAASHMVSTTIFIILNVIAVDNMAPLARVTDPYWQ